MSGAAPRAEEFRPPGQICRVGDIGLHVLCIGQGDPAVVFEAGLGGNYLDWTIVQPLVAARHRACAYDRAGAGFSERTPRPRTPDNFAEELHLAMQCAGVVPPFVLVGHSFGGLLAQSYLGHYPHEVAGLVLVDSMHPEQAERFTAAGVDIPTDPHLILGRTPVAAAAHGLPPELQPLAMQLAGESKVRIFEVREMTAMADVSAAIPAAARCGVPTRVLVHGNAEWNDAYPDGRMERAWLAMQQDLARRFCAPTAQSVGGSGHQIGLDAPNAVADAIEEVSRGVPR